MQKIDLHVHSTISDGTYTPEKIITLAKKNGLAGIAITDHDSIAGVERARKMANRLGIKYFTGMELTISYQSRKLHVVALNFDEKSPAFLALYKKIRQNKESNMEAILDSIARRGLPVSKEAVLPYVNVGEALDRYAIVRYILTTTHSIGKLPMMWNTYLAPALAELDIDPDIDLLTAAKGIHGAGGILSLAHYHKKTGLGGLTRREQEQELVNLVGLGLDGMEGEYSDYNAEERSFAHAMLEKYHLLGTGGSDFHGANRPDNDLGSGRQGSLFVPQHYWDEIIKHR